MADKNDPDIALMLRVKEGDLSAYEALVEKIQTAGDEPRLPAYP